MDRDLERLQGLRILVVEDVFLIADELADLLTTIGCVVVGPSPTLKDGLETATAESLDGALLDVNLALEQTSFPIAEVLAARGVPFLFLSGYDVQDHFPAEFQDAPCLPKPVEVRQLTREMARTFAPAAR
jgi:CheY-like chemotaxis protein